MGPDRRPTTPSSHVRRTVFATPDRVYRAWLEPRRALPLARTARIRGGARRDRSAQPEAATASGSGNTGSRTASIPRPRYFAPVPAGEGAGVFECTLLELVPNRRIVLDWHNVTAAASGSRSRCAAPRGRRRRPTLLSESSRAAPALVGPAAAESTAARPAAGARRHAPSTRRRATVTLRDPLILTVRPARHVPSRASSAPGCRRTSSLTTSIAIGLLGLIAAIEGFEP